LSKLKKPYILALSLIALFAIFSQIFIQLFLKFQEEDGHIINIAGRQRMLSQKITKHSLLLLQAKDEVAFMENQKKLKGSLNLWKVSHKGLQKGDKQLQLLRGGQSPEIKKLFKKINPYFKQIEKAAEALLVLNYLSEKTTKEALILQITENENEFLYLMDQITFQYSEESAAEVLLLQQVEFLLMFLTLFILFLEVFFIFRPAERIVKEQLTKLVNTNNSLIKKNEFISNIRLVLEKQVGIYRETQKKLAKNLAELDISKRHIEKQKDILSKQKLLLDFAEDISQTASFEYDLSSFTLHYSENLSKLLGLPTSKNINLRSLQKLICPKDFIILKEEIKQNLKQGGDFIELTIRIQSNLLEGWHYFKIKGSILYQANKAQKFMGALQDITDTVLKQKKLEGFNKDLKHTEKELRKNLEEILMMQAKLQEQQFELNATLNQNLAINNALDQSAIVSITDIKGKIIKANKIFCEISGYNEEELLGQYHNITNSNYHTPEFWKNMWKTVRQGNTWRAEVKNKTKDGSTYWVDTVVNPIRDENGEIYQFLSIRYLITDRKKIEAKIKERNEQLLQMLKTVEYQKNEIVDSIRYAKRIQRAILPDKKRIELRLPNLMIFYRPKDIVSGDFYWFTIIDGKYYLVAGDCTGHGVPGAFMTVISENLLDQIINKERVLEPWQILTTLDRRILETLQYEGIEDNQMHDGLAISLMKIDLENLELTWAGAKQSLWIFNEMQELIEHKGDRLQIGSSQYWDKIFTQETIKLEKGDTIYSFTDGYPDQFSEDGKKMKLHRFRKLLKENHQKPFTEQEKALKTFIRKWQGRNEQTDDQLIIGFKV